MTPQQQTPQPSAAASVDPEADHNKKLLDSILDRATTYVPFQASDSITLTPAMVLRYFAAPTRSGKTCTLDQAIRFIMLCKARRLNPWEGDAYIVGYDSASGPQFNLITAHQAFLKRAMANKFFDGMESGVLVEKEDGAIVERQGDVVPRGMKLIGGWARVHLRNVTVPVYRSLALATFAKETAVWKGNPAGMIVKCAEADALRSSHPNTLGSLYLSEELVGDSAACPSQPTAPAKPVTIDDVIAASRTEATAPAPAPEEASPATTTTSSPPDDAGEEETKPQPPRKPKPARQQETPDIPF